MFDLLQNPIPTKICSSSSNNIFLNLLAKRCWALWAIFPTKMAFLILKPLWTSSILWALVRQLKLELILEYIEQRQELMVWVGCVTGAFGPSYTYNYNDENGDEIKVFYDWVTDLAKDARPPLVHSVSYGEYGGMCRDRCCYAQKENWNNCSELILRLFPFPFSR